MLAVARLGLKSRLGSRRIDVDDRSMHIMRQGRVVSFVVVLERIKRAAWNRIEVHVASCILVTIYVVTKQASALSEDGLQTCSTVL